MDSTREMPALKTIRLDDIELVRGYYENDETVQIHFATPLNPDTPGVTDPVAEDCAIIYATLDPGRHVPAHTHTEEEILLCMSGTVTVSVDGEEATLTEGELAVVPKQAPHGVRNEGDERAAMLGFLPSGEVHHEFGEPVMPFGEQHFVTKSPVDEDRGP